MLIHQQRIHYQINRKNTTKNKRTQQTTLRT